MKESTRVITALGAAIATGVAVDAIDAAWLTRAADAIAPVGTLWVNAIRMTVIPLVISLLITGIASASNVKAVGRLGGRTLLTFALMLAGVAVVVSPLTPLLFAVLPANASHPALPPGASEWAGQVRATAHGQTFGAWLTSLIPVNPVAAAADGAMMPLVIFTILFALAVVRTNERARTTLTGFFQAVSEAMLVLVRGVILLAPVGVFALVVPLAAHASAALTGAIGLYVVVYSAGAVLLTLAIYPVVAVVARIPMRTFARASLPAQTIAFSSSSSLASLPAMVEGVEVGLGLSPRVTGFVIPLAVSTFKYAAPLSWSVGALFAGWFYGVPLHARELATVAFTGVFLSFATPGVPAGAFILMAPLFTAIGLPVEAIGLLIAVDAIPDRFATVMNVTGDLAAGALVAGRYDRPHGDSTRPA